MLVADANHFASTHPGIDLQAISECLAIGTIYTVGLFKRNNECQLGIRKLSRERWKYSFHQVASLARNVLAEEEHPQAAITFSRELHRERRIKSISHGQQFVLRNSVSTADEVTIECGGRKQTIHGKRGSAADVRASCHRKSAFESAQSSQLRLPAKCSFCDVVTMFPAVSEVEEKCVRILPAEPLEHRIRKRLAYNNYVGLR